MIVGFVLFCIVFVGLTQLVTLRGRKKQDRVWGRVAAKLGLVLDSGRIAGQLNGRAVKCRVISSGSGDNRMISTVASTSFDPPLDMGLVVGKRDVVEDVVSKIVGGPENIPLGDPAADKALSVVGDEPDRVRSALGPTVVASLLRTRSKGWKIGLSDFEAIIEAKGVVLNERWIEQALTTVAEWAALLESSLECVTAASSLEAHHGAWTKYARTNDLDSKSTPTCMSGKLDGSDLSVRAVRVGHLRFEAQLLLRFPSPLSEGLVLRPSGFKDSVSSLLGGEDTKVGDEPFDDAFSVRSNKPDRLGQLLDASVRRTLLQLGREAAKMELRDEGITLTLSPFPENPDLIPRLVSTLAGVMREIHNNATRLDAAIRGVYR